MHVSVWVFGSGFGCYLACDDEVSVIIVERRVCRPRVNAFLFVVTTPPLGLGWLIHAGISCLGGFELGPLMVLPR